MSRSVYSVILNDELVEELDRAAYKSGVSRSTMLDKILAEYLLVETPAVRMENIFGVMENMISEWSGLRFINRPQLSMAAVQSALTYRYNPTVKYSVELYQSGEDLGEIKMSLRTQNPTLIALMEKFYSFLIGLEKKYLGEREYVYEGFKFTRIMKNPKLKAEETGESIAYYVKAVNYLLNEYFKGLDDLPRTETLLERKFREEIVKNIAI